MLRNRRVQGRILLGVGMTAVDHDVGKKFRRLESCLTTSGMLRAVIRSMASPSQYEMPITIAAGFEDRDLTVRVDPQKTMRFGD